MSGYTERAMRCPPCRTGQSGIDENRIRMSEPQPEENKFDSEIHDCVKRSPSLREKITVSLEEPSARLIL